MLTFNQYWAWFWSLLPSLVATKKMMVAWRSWAPHTAPQLPVSILRMLLAVVFQQLLCCLSPNLNCIQHWMKSYFVICTQLLHHSIGSRSCSSQIEFSNKHSRNRHYHCSNPLLNQSENMFSFTDKDNKILAGSRGWAKSFLKIPYPLKIFVLMYKNILIYKSF